MAKLLKAYNFFAKRACFLTQVVQGRVSSIKL